MNTWKTLTTRVIGVSPILFCGSGVRGYGIVLIPVVWPKFLSHVKKSLTWTQVSSAFANFIKSQHRFTHCQVNCFSVGFKSRIHFGMCYLLLSLIMQLFLESSRQLFWRNHPSWAESARTASHVSCYLAGQKSRHFVISSLLEGSACTESAPWFWISSICERSSTIFLPLFGIWRHCNQSTISHLRVPPGVPGFEKYKESDFYHKIVISPHNFIASVPIPYYV